MKIRTQHIKNGGKQQNNAYRKIDIFNDLLEKKRSNLLPYVTQKIKSSKDIKQRCFERNLIIKSQLITCLQDYIILLLLWDPFCYSSLKTQTNIKTYKTSGY